MTPSTPPAPLGRLIPTGTVNLWTHVAGAGTPPVVILPGAGMFGLSYYPLQSRIAEHTTCVLYDRGGTGWSDDITLTRSAAEVAEELKVVLDALQVAQPIVLLAHSLGALYARRFARLFPERVAGLLLVDPASERYRDFLTAEAREFEHAMQQQPDLVYSPELVAMWRPIFEQMYAPWPDALREAIINRHVEPARALVGLWEARNADALYEELRAVEPGTNPCEILTAAGVDPAQKMYSPEHVIVAQNAAKVAANAALAQSMGGARHQVLDDAMHTRLQVTHENVILDALMRLVRL